MILHSENVSKHYRTIAGSDVAALSNVSFKLDAGSFLSVVGPSGSGKSTLLNLLSGVEEPTYGRITFFQENSSVKIGYVLQENALFPWLTIEKNLTYALSLRGASSIDREYVALELCSQLGLTSDIFLKKYPKELSGGERRRVAIGMALAIKPDILMLDEPSGQLDYQAKWSIQGLIQKLGKEQGLTVLCVTHDLEEAVFLGDQILMLDNGIVSNFFSVDLPRPRPNEIRTSEKFNDYRRKLMDRYYD